MSESNKCLNCKDNNTITPLKFPSDNVRAKLGSSQSLLPIPWILETCLKICPECILNKEKQGRDQKKDYRIGSIVFIQFTEKLTFNDTVGLVSVISVKVKRILHACRSHSLTTH